MKGLGSGSRHTVQGFEKACPLAVASGYQEVVSHTQCDQHDRGQGRLHAPCYCCCEIDCDCYCDNMATSSCPCSFHSLYEKGT